MFLFRDCLPQEQLLKATKTERLRDKRSESRIVQTVQCYKKVSQAIKTEQKWKQKTNKFKTKNAWAESGWVSITEELNTRCYKKNQEEWVGQKHIDDQKSKAKQTDAFLMYKYLFVRYKSAHIYYNQYVTCRRHSFS